MRLISILIFAAALLTACDDGRIYPDDIDVIGEGRTVKVICPMEGVVPWSKASGGYSLALAAFAEGSQYALVTRAVTSATDSVMSLTGVPAEASTVALCVIDRLRKRVATIAEAPVDGTVTFGPADVSPLAVVQKAVLTPTCSACHGGSGHAAAGLSLISAEATRRATVGIEAHRAIDGAHLRVAPGDPDSSLLYRALTTDISASWAYDHSVEVVNPAMRSLIEIWIASEK